MTKQLEDKMVLQIEKNLSNHIDENVLKDAQQPIVSFDYSNPISISRAEYIRQARESCLRQLSEMQSTARAYDSYYLDTVPKNAESEQVRNHKRGNLFQDGAESGKASQEEGSATEINAFRFLIIRMVCAIMIFLSIFLIDKFDIKIGAFTPDKVEEYVTGKDNLKELETILVSWLKEE